MFPIMTYDNDNPLRLGVLLSGGGRTLLNICDEIDAGRLPATVGVVIASRECKGIERAKARGLRAELVPYKQMPDAATYSARIAEILGSESIDLVILAGFLSLWEIPQQYEGKVMNIHPALLPKFGGHGMWGHHVHEAVLAAGETKSGCTVHIVTNEYDAGPIVLQKTVPVLDGDTPDALADRVFEVECLAFPEAIALFAAGKV
jgi:phosphoribosylglycinamide formyltransferase 1